MCLLSTWNEEARFRRPRDVGDGSLHRHRRLHRTQRAPRGPALAGPPARHQVLVCGQLKHFGGREIDTAGDGFFAIFDQFIQMFGRKTASASSPLSSMIRPS
jgi:hypothetical protein